jgi:hypothetical protein
MEKPQTSYKIIIFMLIVYAIASIQFLAQEIKYLAKVAPMTYSDKLTYLDKQYYRNSFYEYFDWLDNLLPKDTSFSLLFNEKTDFSVYVRYAHKFDYYLYPRHVMFTGIEQDVAAPPLHWPTKDRLKHFIYSDAVFTLKIKDVDFKQASRLKYIILNGRRYYLVAVKDDKGLLLNKSLLVRKNDMENIAVSFKSLYGIDITKAVF